MSGIYNIPLSCSFVDTLAQKFSKEYEENKEALADVIFLMPNRRTCISLRDAFVRYNGKNPTILPKMLPVGDLSEDGVLSLGVNHEELLDSPLPIMDDYESLFDFAKLIYSKPADYGLAETTYAQAFSLAKDLSSLIDISYNEDISFEKLEEIVPSEYSAHWQQTLKFLKIITTTWPKILKENNMMAAGLHKNNIISLAADLWRKQNTDQTIVLAGVTVNYKSIRKLTETIMNLKNGAVYLYGLDKNMDDEDWEEVKEEHPQFELKKLLEDLKINRENVKDCADSLNKEREKFVSEFMLPAKSTLKWRNLKTGDYASEALKKLSFIECTDERQEALRIALIMREVLNTEEKTVALVTSDRNLARRTASELARWNIKIDDSAGIPLHLSPIGVFLRLILNVPENNFSDASMLALAKNPFVKLSRAPLALLEEVRKWELKERKPVFSAEQKEIPEELLLWKKELKELLRPLFELYEVPSVPFSVMLKTHLEIAEQLCDDGTNSGDKNLWKAEDGKKAADLFSKLLQYADEIKSIKPQEYAAVLTTLLSSQNVRSTYGTHPRLKILGPIEARFNQFDTVIIGGINEGIWPETPSADPWLSRPMKETLGMTLPEKSIGISAFDFCQLMCASNVYLTRANRANSSPTNKSRWLLRMETVLKSCNIEPEGLKNDEYSFLSKIIDMPNVFEKPVPPAPCPPIEARPRKLSATTVEKLMRDPYEVYANHILKLKPLKDLDQELSFSDYGNIIHKILERFCNKYPSALPQNSYEEILKIGMEEFSKNEIAEEIRAFWWPSFEKTAVWFLDVEKEYRSEIKKVNSEVEGEIVLKAPKGDFVITARADRLDIKKDGTVNIIDYKTGQIKSKTEVMSGYAPQLPIGGLIASKGGFFKIKDGQKENIAAADVSSLVYYKICDTVASYDVEDTDNSLNLIEKTEDNLEALIRAFDSEDQPYMARPNPKQLPQYSDYEHLARVKEWTVEDE